MSTILSNNDFGEANAFCAILPGVSKQSAIAELIENCGLSYRDIERASGGKIKFNTISDYKTNPHPNPELDTILALAKGMGVSPSIVFEAFCGTRPGRLGVRSDYLREALEAYEALPQTDREQLSTTVEMLIGEIMRRRKH